MRKLCLMLLLGGMFLLPARSDQNLTFDGGTAFQLIDGIGVNVNARNWDGANLQPVLNAFMEDAGMSLFRVTYDLADWEQANDDSDPDHINWSYFNSIYGSTTNEFPKLWDTFAYLNSRGYTNRAFFCFMGWGPDWMMDPSIVSFGETPKLLPGMEAEWAETVASLIIYARNMRGLQFDLISPNNEPDNTFEGVEMDLPATGTNATQYIVALRKLAQLLDSNNVANLKFVAPDRASGPSGYDTMPAMMADPAIMNRTAHFASHSYSDGGGATPQVYQYVNGSAFADRRLWVTEFNKWCAGCDSGSAGNHDWTYTSGTAINLIWHLYHGASAALVWEGYDGIYRHHRDTAGNWVSWGFWGLVGVDNTNAVNPTYTPRKHYYTVSQISKWVRPGAQQIDYTGASGNLNPITVFKHEALGMVTIVGYNSDARVTLNGTLSNLPAVPELQLYYTDSTSNLTLSTTAPVNGSGSFSASIPANCIFTLVGNTAKKLTNGVSRAGSSSGGTLEHFYLDITNPVARAQFEVNAPSGDVDLFVEKNLPSDGVTLVKHSSANSGTNSELVVLRPGNGPMALAPGRWYLSVLNKSGTNANYSVKATQWSVSGTPLIVSNVSASTNGFCLTWNTVPGGIYVIQSADSVGTGPWQDATPTLTATNSMFSYCLPLASSTKFFRVLEDVAVNGP